MKQFFAILLLAMVTTVAGAKDVQQKPAEQIKSDALHPKIIVKSVELVKATEKSGDELYFVITEFNSRNENLQYTIPRYPITWPSKALKQINNLKVWSGNLYDGDTVELMIELVESDSPPFDVDDSVGAGRITLKNDKGALKTEWSARHEMTEYKERKEGKETIQQYTFKSEGGDYVVKFVMN